MPVTPHVHRSRSLIAVALLLFAPALAGAQSTFQTVGNLHHLRAFSTATPLADGRILVTGGVDSGAGQMAPSEVFDPVTGISTLTGAMHEIRALHAAVLLANGRVAVFGGRNLETSVNCLSVEVYDPDTNAWTVVATLNEAHESALAATLPDGRILVAGGSAAVALFDPVTNMVSSGAPLLEPRDAFHRAIALDNGRVLVLGGSATTTPELYDPATDTWSATGPLMVNRMAMDVARLPDGRVLAAGGFPVVGGGVPLADAEIYDPATNLWSATGSLRDGRLFHSLSVLGDGRIIASGGLDADLVIAVNSTEVFNPAAGTWTEGPIMPVPRLAHVGAVAADGSLYLIGGSDTTQVDMLGRDPVPTADAGADVTANGCYTCTNSAVVSAAGSSDDGPLVYTWSLGATVLAQSADPVDTATLPLEVGTHTVMLTVRDSLGQEDTDTVMVTIVAVDDAYLAQIGALEAALAACEAGGGGDEAVTALMDGFEQHLRKRFRNPSFELPGATAIDELSKLLRVITKADQDVQKKIYRALGGRKKHSGHKGRWSPHWDDDCDHDEDQSDRDRGKRRD